MDLIKPGDFYRFTVKDFTNNYFDLQGDLPNSIIIYTLPTKGVLTFKNKIINKIKTIISLNEINEINDLKYIRLNSEAYTDTFNFKISDINQNTKFNLSMATFTINVNAYENEPPTIGDNEISLNFGATKTFTIADFTTNTTPPYADPEGDGPYKLKVTSLPTTGELRYDNIPVTLDQEILFTDIGLGLFTYIPDIVDLDGYDDDTFEFEISDLGSQEFSS
jgi:hypothetical protein